MKAKTLSYREDNKYYNLFNNKIIIKFQHESKNKCLISHLDNCNVSAQFGISGVFFQRSTEINAASPFVLYMRSTRFIYDTSDCNSL